MTTYYCQHGHSGTNAGTLANPFNDLISVLNDSTTFGPGDVIYIATRNEADTADIDISNANIDMQVNGAIDGFVSYIVDPDGSIFSTADGYITITNSQNNPFCQFAEYNEVRFNNRARWITLDSNTSADYGWFDGIISGIIFQLGSSGGDPCNYIFQGPYGGYCLIEDITFDMRSTSDTIFGPIRLQEGGCIEARNITFDYSNNVGGYSELISTAHPKGAMINIKGLSILGDSSSSLRRFINLQTSGINANGFCIIDGLYIEQPLSSSFVPSAENANVLLSPYTSDAKSIMVKGGVDVNDWMFGNAVGSFMYQEGDLNPYPSRGAKLYDDSNIANATAFSIKVNPAIPSITVPLISQPTQKLYEDASATKTITLELLYDSSQTPDDHDLWIEFSYITTTGKCVTETTRPNLYETSTTIPVSTATWSATSYGSLALTKRKITLTTEQQIKQYTEMKLRLFCALPRATNGAFFYDPDFSVT